MTETSPSTVGAVDRATQVLQMFVETGARTLGVTEIATALDLSKAVVHRVLASLREAGFLDVEAGSRRYRLGPAALALGLAYLERIDLRTQARPVLERLSAATQETATLSVRHGDQRIYVDQVTPLTEIRMTVPLGRPYPLHAGSSSKAFLAFLSDAEQADYLTRDLPRLTEATVTDSRALAKELAAIRKRGYAKSLGERQPGAASVAAPVFDHEGHPVGAVSVCGPIERFRSRTDEAATLLVEGCRELSRQLGFS
jgi:IclR family acetate operon transcriptional repressor